MANKEILSRRWFKGLRKPAEKPLGRQYCESLPDLDPGMGTDLTQDGRALARAIRCGKVDPTNSTLKPNERWKKKVA